MASNLEGLPWADSREGYGYITIGPASPPYNAAYKIPGTVHNYYCRKFIIGITFRCTSKSELKSSWFHI
jgi:hypothetical protein